MVERGLNLLWIALGLATIAGAIGIGVWEPSGPGGGFLPLVAGLVITLTGATLAFASTPGTVEWPRGWIAMRIAVVLLGLVAIGFAMPHVGFVAAAIPVMIALMLVIERQSFAVVLAVSVLSSVSIYLLFTRLLGTKLPASHVLGF